MDMLIHVVVHLACGTNNYVIDKIRNYQEHIMKKEKGEGKEHEAPTHLIKISRLTHVARVTKNSKPQGM